MKIPNNLGVVEHCQVYAILASCFKCLKEVFRFCESIVQIRLIRYEIKNVI